MTKGGHWGVWPESRHKTSFGLSISVAEPSVGANSPHWDDLVNISRTAVDAGFESLWYADHFSFPTDDGLRGSWDVWTFMAAIVAAVPGVSIGPMVACTAYRNPGVIAKMTEMIQDISGGRFILGLGAGWQKDEYQQFGLPFEPRVTRFEEALQIIHGLLREGKADVQGKYSQANNAVNLPRAASGATTPILIGSSGERMLGLLARYADAWDTGWGGDTPGLLDKIAKLDAACEAAGRDPKSVLRTVSVPIAADGYDGDPEKAVTGTTEEKVVHLRQFVDLGFSHLRVSFSPMSPAAVEAFAPVIAAFHRS